MSSLNDLLQGISLIILCILTIPSLVMSAYAVSKLNSFATFPPPSLGVTNPNEFSSSKSLATFSPPLHDGTNSDDFCNQYSSGLCRTATNWNCDFIGNQSIDTVTWTRDDLSGYGKVIACLISHHSFLNVSVWRISRTSIQKEDMVSISNALANGGLENLKEFSANYNGISNLGMNAFAAAITPTHEFPTGALASLMVLYLHDNKIGDDGMNAFSAALSSGSLAHLKILDLNQNWIGSDNMIRFSAALSNGALPNLEYLNLEHNQIGDTGMAAFANVTISALGNLYSLGIDNNQIGDKGMIAFAKAIKPADEGSRGALASLTLLSITDNDIGDAGMIAFAKAIKPDEFSIGAMVNIRTLYMTKKGLNETTTELLDAACRNRSINCLYPN